MRLKVFVLLIALLLACPVISACAQAGEETALYSGGSCIMRESGGGYILYDTYLSGSLRLDNRTEAELSVTVYSDGGKAELCAAPGDTVRTKLSRGELAAVRIKQNGGELSYALTETGLRALLGDGAGELRLLRDIDCAGNLDITAPAVISTGDFCLRVEGNIIYKTDKKGTLKLDGAFSAHGFGADAPRSQIILPEPLVPEHLQLEVNAKTLNGTALSPGCRIVSSQEELKLLCEKKLSLMPGDDETVVLKDLVLTAPAVLDFPVRVRFENTDCAGMLSFETKEQGEITLLGELEPKSIKINAPACNIRWEDCPLTVNEANRLYTAASLNGASLSGYSLGGEGRAEIFSAVLGSGGRLMTEDIVWTAEGNILRAIYTGVAAPSELRDAQLQFDATGKVTPEAICTGESGGVNLLAPSGCFVLAEDGDGKTRRYQIITEIKAKLPVVCLETENGAQNISRELYSAAAVTVDGSLAGDKTDSAPWNVQIKGRGNSSWYWAEKKSYKIKYSEPVSLLGMKPGKDWVLISNYYDKSLLRNYVALETAKLLDNMNCYASQLPVNVFMDGEYIGVYTLGEQIEVSDGRLPLRCDASSVDTGYFMEIGGIEEESPYSFFSTPLMHDVRIISPGKGAVSEKMHTYLLNYMRAAESAVISHEGYDAYIDTDSLIDWLIMTELSFNTDSCMRRSVFFTKDSGGKIKFGPVWDFDLAYGNCVSDFAGYGSWACLATERGYVPENWLCHLMKDESFVRRMRLRWNSVKYELLDASLAALRRGEEMTAASAAENFRVWQILDTRLSLQPEDAAQYDTYEKQLRYLESFIRRRWQWIDSTLNS